MASTEIRDRRRTLRYRNLVLKQMVQMKNRVSGLLKPRDMKPRDEKYPMLGSPLPFAIGLLFDVPGHPVLARCPSKYPSRLTTKLKTKLHVRERFRPGICRQASRDRHTRDRA